MRLPAQRDLMSRRVYVMGPVNVSSADSFEDRGCALPLMQALAGPRGPTANSNRRAAVCFPGTCCVSGNRLSSGRAFIVP